MTIKKKALYSYFLAAFHRSSQDYGYGFKSFMERRGCMTAAFATMVLKGYRKASVKKQRLVAQACGYGYQDYLALGKAIVQNSPAGREIGVQQNTASETFQLLQRLEHLSPEEFNHYTTQLKQAVQTLEQKTPDTGK